MSKADNKIKVGISIGDINGIGMEIIIKSFMDNRLLDLCTPVVFGSSKIASFYRKTLNIPDFSFNIINDIKDINHKKANLLNCWKEEVNLNVGESTKEGGKYALKSLQIAVDHLAQNKVDVLVTAPINKSNIQSAEFDFPGHTEYLANYANAENPLMIMCAGNLRVGLVSGHLPLKDVASAITVEAIVKKANALNKSLQQDFNIRKPKIAILGLNPHAGDNGLLGKEENDVIAPAIKECNNMGILAFGPYPADGLFGSDNLKNFDGVLAMYHDQGLTPFKAVAFDEGVNFTAGLPIVRTSPDHGVGYSIAGKNEASEASFRNAIYTACDVYKTRNANKELLQNTMDKVEVS